MQITDSDKQFTLLLVDDNPTNLLLLTKIIELDLPDVRVLTAKSAMEGLELSGREQIDGAFIDVQMPHMSGLDMCRHLNDNPRTNGIPLVLMTAHLALSEKGFVDEHYKRYISRMEVATPVTSVKVAILSSMGKRRWSIILTVPWSHSTVRMRYLQT